MSPKRRAPTVTREQVVRLWLERQGLSRPRGSSSLTPDALTGHLESTGALQLDSINVVDRAHYLTLWSRFGSYAREDVDRWIYGERTAYEYWGHEASILPMSHLPVGSRRMRRFPPDAWTRRSWWSTYATSPGSKRRVLTRIRAEGPLESTDFEARDDEFGPEGPPGGAMPLSREDRRSLKLLWHAGRIAVAERRHFRCVYDLADRVYPEVEPVHWTEFEDSWLLIGLSGNGISAERHLVGYVTGPAPDAATRARILRRNLRRGTVVEVRVEGSNRPWLALPEHLDALDRAAREDPSTGTTLLSPFDSLLWQRKRAEELLGFRYRVEIYVPRSKRQFGYYVLPILHDGRLVGRLDPKLHRDEGILEIKAIVLEDGIRRDERLTRGLGAATRDLASFLGADRIRLPRGWRDLT